MKIFKVVKNRGYEAFALEGTRIRFDVSRAGRGLWRFRAWDVLGPVTIGKGVERTKVQAINAAMAVLFQMEREQAAKGEP